jgi:hypothetical protein
MLILAVCICSHVSEIFDHWDNTFQTGNDVESSTIIVALIAGAALGLTHVAAMTVCVVSGSRLLPLFVTCLLSALSPAVSISHSPPQPLRI